MFESRYNKSHLRVCLKYKACALKAHCQCGSRTLSTWAAQQQIVTADTADYGQRLVCVSVCSPGYSCGALCCGAQSHCWKPQWKRSIAQIPATWDSSVSAMLHCLINTFSEETGGKSPVHGHTMMEHGFKNTDMNLQCIFSVLHEEM